MKKIKTYINFLFRDSDNTRIGRKDFFLGWLSSGIVLIILSIPFFLILALINNEILLWIFLIIFAILRLSALISLSIKRFHDLNMSSYSAFYLFIPLINVIAMFILFFIKGIEKDNSYKIEKLFL